MYKCQERYTEVRMYMCQKAVHRGTYVHVSEVCVCRGVKIMHTVNGGTVTREYAVSNNAYCEWGYSHT
jgi:hypothetical protein